jgi:acyl CoA:acetate/3-ketoacid CoA transferase alpha subunit/acyl CoA:acetate/3-ketoacid CoA transferase beta subunit
VTDQNLETGANINSKVLTLKEAVAAYVKPWMKVHLAGGIGGPSAAICEIIRQYYGKSPGFELIQSTVTGHSLNLLHCKLLNKMIFAACMDISPSGRPSKIMQQQWGAKRMEFENWSLCSLQQRLLAGALGLDFMPTRSLAGSSLAESNSNGFQEITNPFDIDKKVGLVKSLNPDISIVHACLADEMGNSVLAVPYGDDLWGALASQSVLVTVEKVVTTAEIRRYSALVKIPSYMVKAVCVAPMGLHPFSLASPHIGDLKGYETDTEFLKGLHQASLDNSLMDQWIKEWVLECPDQESYLKKLGQTRLDNLQYNPGVITKSEGSSSKNSGTTIYSNEEMLLIAASREIKQKIMRSRHKTVLLGAGSRSAAVLLAYYQLIAAGYELNIVTGNGQYGYDPFAGEIAVQNLAAIYSSKMVTDTVTAQGILIGGQNNRCLGVLGAGQIDKYANINSTLTSSGQFLVGSGGANDVGNASEVIVILSQSKEKFVDVLPFITCPGNRVSTVISNLGIFRKETGKREIIISACLPDAQLRLLSDRIIRIKSECGWQIRMAEKVLDVPEPAADELEMLRKLAG